MKPGPCAKLTTTATITTKDGKKFVGQNWCANPQEKCPRGDMPTGEGYELCREVCQQIGHAEVVACFIAGPHAKGAELELEGHHYFCDNCLKIMVKYGIYNIVFVNSRDIRQNTVLNKK